MRFSLTRFELIFRSTLRLLSFAVIAGITTTAFADSGSSPVSTASLPDAPSATLASSSSLTDESGTTATNGDGLGWQSGHTSALKQMALGRVKFIEAGQQAPKQKASDKILLGMRESVTPFAMLGWVFSAGWSQVIDSSPNYGRDGKAFSQRLGAAAALNSSKIIFSDSVLATAFHQDPRYYQLGPSHKFMTRAIYAATRPVVGRTDGGRTIPNYAFILGTGGAASLTHTYYPERNVTPGQVMQTWGTSLGGSAVGYLVTEFGGDLIGWLRVNKHN